MTKTRQSARITTVCIAILFICLCTTQLATRRPEIIEVKYERMYLEPFSGMDLLCTYEGWPQDRQSNNFLLQEITTIWKTLLAEFRRCEKYGLYTMVDSTGSSTMCISPRIVSIRMSKDTLFMPIELQTRNISQKQTKTMTITIFGISGESDTTTIQKLSTALSDFRRKFPYKETVALFYTPAVSED